MAVLGAGAGKAAIVGGSPPLSTIVLDTFTRADGAVGNAETGQTWVVGNNGDVATLPTFSISANSLRLQTSGTAADAHVWAESGKANCIIDADLVLSVSTDLNPCGVLFRRQDASNYWAARMNRSNGDVQLMRNLAGSRSTQITVNKGVIWADNQMVRMRVILNGVRMRIFIDGVLFIDTSAFSDFATATKHGGYFVANSKLDMIKVSA